MIARNRATDFHRRTADFVELPDNLESPGTASAPGRRERRAGGDPLAARRVSRNPDPAARRRTLRAGDRGAYRPDAGLRAREPASRHEDAARQAGPMTGRQARPVARRLSLGRLRRARCGDRPPRGAAAAVSSQGAAAAAAGARAAAPPLRLRGDADRHRRRVAGAGRGRGLVRAPRSARRDGRCSRWRARRRSPARASTRRRGCRSASSSPPTAGRARASTSDRSASSTSSRTAGSG